MYVQSPFQERISITIYRYLDKYATEDGRFFAPPLLGQRLSKTVGSISKQSRTPVVTGSPEISSFKFLPRTAATGGLYEFIHGKRDLSICLRDSPKSNERFSPPSIGDVCHLRGHRFFPGKAVRYWALSRSRPVRQKHRSRHGGDLSA